MSDSQTPEPEDDRADARARARAAALRGEAIVLEQPEEPEDAADPSDLDDDEDEADDAARRRRSRRRPRQPREWRTGGTSVQHWSWLLVGWAVVALGAGVLASTAATQFVGGALGGWIGTVAIWVALLVPVILAFRISRPRGLLRFRAVDLLFGVVLGVALRVVSGWLTQAATGSSPWPSYGSGTAALGGGWWFDELLVPVLIGPVIEELFFHGFLLIALFTAFRRLTASRFVAGLGAALVSTGMFVLLHQLTGSLTPSWDGAASVALVGVTGALLVLLTGRLWPAVVLHVVFNGSYVVLAIAGTLLGTGAPVGPALS